jgi:hypothetical protein
MYSSRAHKEGQWWIVQNDQHPGALSQVKRLDLAAEAQREAIAFVAKVPVASVEVTVQATVSPDIDQQLAEASALRMEAQAKEQRAASIRQTVAEDLEADGFTLREIGLILGVSYQRAHQLRTLQLKAHSVRSAAELDDQIAAERSGWE